MKKKLISLVMSACMCLSFSISAYASTPNEKVKNNPEIYNDPLYNSPRTLEESEIFIPDDSGNLILNPNVNNRAVVGNTFGQIRVDQSYSGDSGIVQTTSKSGPWSTIKYSTIKILPYIPGVGELYNTCSDIYDGLKAIYTDITRLDPSKTTNVYTRYVYGYYYLDGYAWDYSNTWKYMGESTSKEFYLVQTIDGIVDGKFQSFQHEYTREDNCLPKAVAKAPHYKDSSGLSQIFYEHWATGIGRYYETY